MWTHTQKCTYIQTHTRNDRKDWSTCPRYKRAWHSGHPLICNLVKLSGKEGGCSTNLPIYILKKGRKRARDLEEVNGVGQGGGMFLPH